MAGLGTRAPNLLLSYYFQGASFLKRESVCLLGEFRH